MNIGFDLDGCVVDFCTSFFNIMNNRYQIPVDRCNINMVTEYDMLLKMCSDNGIDSTSIIRETLSHSTLDMYPDVYTTLLKYIYWHHKKLIFITSRTKDCCDLTYRWLQHYLKPKDFSVYYVSDSCYVEEHDACYHEKYEVCKDLNIDIMIEDAPKHIDLLMKHGIYVAVPLMPWNIRYCINKRVDRYPIYKIKNWHVNILEDIDDYFTEYRSSYPAEVSVTRDEKENMEDTDLSSRT